jgi:hypothetical protein
MEEALRRYPFKVYFPQPGEYHLLIIHSENDQQELLLAKTEEGLRRLYDVKTKQNNYPKTARGHWVIKMVAPTQHMREEYAAKKYEWDLSTFRFSIAHEMERLLRRNFKTEGVSLCKKFMTKEKNVHPSDKEYHTDCLNCGGLQVIFHRDVEDLYEEKRDLLEKLHDVGRPSFRRLSTKKIITPRALEPLATEEADPHKDIFAAMAHHGPHSKGNVLEPVSDSLIYSFAAGGYSFPLFLCQGEEVSKVYKWAADKQAAWIKRREEAEKNRGKATAKEQNRNDKEREKLLKEIFT